MSAYDRVFAAVFPPASEFDIPTPKIGSSSFGESFGSPFLPETTPVSAATEQIRWNRAWHTATAFLLLPNVHITVEQASQVEEVLKRTWFKPFTPEVSKALKYVVSEDSPGHHLRKQQKKDNLLRWYEEMGTRHYLEYVRPSLLTALLKKDTPTALDETTHILQVTQGIYLYPLKSQVLTLLPRGGEEEYHRIRSNFHSLFICSLSQSGYAQHLTSFLKERASAVLGLDATVTDFDDERQRALSAIKSLNSVGLGGAKAQRLFAEVMNDVLTDHIKLTYARNWTYPSTVTETLRDWIENYFARFVVEVLNCVKDGSGPPNSLTEVTLADVERWQVMGINKLGALRTSELFDIVVNWDGDTRGGDTWGGIEDLKRYTTTTSARTHVTTAFSNDLSNRLLHPGASTLSILQVYISIIRAFAVLDPKGVLLDRVAQPIRRYLREREDTVTVVVGGLLTDPEDESSEVLAELAVEMDKIATLDKEKEMDDGLDLDDMNWMPDPVDAGPEYKKSKQSDVIGSLISLFDSNDVFVKEFQNFLGERLLKKEFDYEKEASCNNALCGTYQNRLIHITQIRVLELLKLEIGEQALPSCEVMLRDMTDSRRVDQAIRKDQKLKADKTAPEFHSRILSHLFWPPLHSESFSIPPEIESIQARYSSGFESLKKTRKLTWLQALGQVVVELDLEDRKITEEVSTWQASVIYAFQPHPNNSNSTTSDAPLTKTLGQLANQLQMSESLVHNALTFWTSKLVLRESPPGTFSVLETLPSSSSSSYSFAIPSAAAAAAVAAPAAIRSTGGGNSGDENNTSNTINNEIMALCWQYSIAMLTNQGAMPLQKIVAYLGVFVPGGFPYGNEVMREFLDKKVEEGKLEVGSGGVYKIVM